MKNDHPSSHQPKSMARHLVCLVAANRPLVSQLRKTHTLNGTKRGILTRKMLSMEVSFKSEMNISEEPKEIDFKSNRGKLRRLKVESSKNLIQTKTQKTLPVVLNLKNSSSMDFMLIQTIRVKMTFCLLSANPKIFVNKKSLRRLTR